tara:strand:- start:228 stop:728 length:501 start_codon:yes stop_codon:yes gene_type:complete
MSFRTERKFILKKENIQNFYMWLNENNCKNIYEKRLVSSVYFENKYNQMYQDSDEGVLPRKKIRIRNYNNNTNKYLLEKKISSSEGRYKISLAKKNIDMYNKIGIFDNQYGICKPTIKVSYLREYYSFKDYRITFDQNISYKKLNSRKEFKDNYCVIEFKKKKYFK